jgi:ankyrin repeat protein
MADISNPIVFPSSFSDKLVWAMTDSPSKELDEKIYFIVTKKALFKDFADWVIRNPDWGREHLSVTHDLVMLALSKEIIQSAVTIEKIVSHLWPSPEGRGLDDSFVWFTFSDSFWSDDDPSPAELIRLDAFEKEKENGLRTRLIEAVHSKNRLRICSALLKYINHSQFFADLDVVETALEQLSVEEQTAFVKLSEGGATLLHQLTGKHNAELFKMLLNAVVKAERKAVLSSLDSEGHSVLRRAFSDGDAQIVGAVMEEFAEEERVEQVELALSGADFLHESLYDSRLQLFRAVIDAVPDGTQARVIRIKNKMGENLLNFAVNSFLDKAVEEMFSLLHISYDCDDLLETGELSVNALHYAALLGQTKIVKGILNVFPPDEQTAVVQLSDRSGKTPLHYAAHLGDEELFTVLLSPVSVKQRSAFVHAADVGGRTALHLAVISGNAKSLQMLLAEMPSTERELGMDREDKAGWSPLYYSVKRCIPELVQVVVSMLPETYQTKIVHMVKRLTLERPQHAFEILKSVSSVIPAQVSHLMPVFKVEQHGEKLYLLGKDPSFLREKGRLIGEYAAKIAHPLGIEEFKIKEVRAGEDRQYGFIHSIALHRLLPNTLLASYGQQAPNQAKANCYGAAMMASGITSAMTYMELSDSFSLAAAIAQKISLPNLSLGDLVFLKEGPEESYWPGEEGAHSFVFLSHDFCLSMNGWGQPLEFYSTADVLQRYGYPGDILRTPHLYEKYVKHIEIFRKVTV